MIKTVRVNLTTIKKHTGVLFPGHDIELKLIELYCNKVTRDHNTIKEFTDIVISRSYYKDGKYPYNEIRGFYDSNKYLNILIRILTIIEHYIYHEIEDPNFDLVTFNRYIRNDDIIEVEYDVKYSNRKQ